MTQRIGNLEWMADLPEAMQYHEAVKFVAELGDGWRLPTAAEAVTLWNYPTNTYTMPPTDDFIAPGYWTSERESFVSWMFDRGMLVRSNHLNEHRVKCVRSAN